MLYSQLLSMALNTVVSGQCFFVLLTKSLTLLHYKEKKVVCVQFTHQTSLSEEELFDVLDAPK